MTAQPDRAAAPGSAPAPLDARLAVVAVAGWAATAAGVRAGSAVEWTLAAGALAGGACAAVRALLRVRSRASWATVAAVLLATAGIAAGAAVRIHHVEANPVTTHYGAGHEMSATVGEDPRPIGPDASGGEVRVLVRAQLRSIRTAGRERSASGRVAVFAPADGWAGLLPGTVVRFHGILARPDRHDLTVATITATGPPDAVGPPSRVQRLAGGVRQRFAQVCARVLEQREAGLLRGLVLGDVSDLPADAAAQFRAAGLTHLTAVSGSNFALVCGMILLMVRPLGPRWAAAVTAVAIVGVVVLVRPSPSVLRAAAMGMVGVAALATGRRRQALPALGAAVLVLTVWHPELAVDPGFAMSAAATAAIVVLVPVWTDRLRAGGVPGALGEQVAVAVAAHAVTIPIVAAIAGSVSLVAVAANLLAAAAVAPATVLGALAAAVAPWWGAAAEMLVRAAAPPVWWLGEVARWCAQVPWAQVAVPGGALGAVVSACAVAGVFAWYASAVFRRCAVAAVLAAESVWLPAHWTGLPW